VVADAATAFFVFAPPSTIRSDRRLHKRNLWADHELAICSYGSSWVSFPHRAGETALLEEIIMKTWTKPAVREQEVGLEVTSYLPAEIDVI
jgi:coenzyme PQQ precursor peptide PqqA